MTRLKRTVNALTCPIAVVTWAMTPIVGHGGEGGRRELDQDDADAVGVLDPALGQTSGLGGLRARMAGSAQVIGHVTARPRVDASMNSRNMPTSCNFRERMTGIEPA